MEVIRTIPDMRSFVKNARLSNQVIGLVPTMGALHLGHMSLVDLSSEQCDLTITTIFVNPTQFNSPEDLANYPSSINEDLAMLENKQVDAVFVPDVKEIYPEDSLLKIQFGYLETIMEGSSRPGHFAGVGMIVSKLFNITRPDRAYFGQKDLQQLVLIKHLERMLDFGIHIVTVPTVREPDGLAMSSRNRRLSNEERMIAIKLYQSLKTLQKNIKGGMAIDVAIRNVKRNLQLVNGIQLDYLEVVDAITLQKVNHVNETKEIALCIAAYVGSVRLLDNILLN